MIKRGKICHQIVDKNRDMEGEFLFLCINLEEILPFSKIIPWMSFTEEINIDEVKEMMPNKIVLGKVTG